jgi:hypothetical protein
MHTKKLLLKLSILVLGLVALQTFAQPGHNFICRFDQVPCQTESDFGFCSLRSLDCSSCKGNDGSVLANAPECIPH